MGIVTKKKSEPKRMGRPPILPEGEEWARFDLAMPRSLKERLAAVSARFGSMNQAANAFIEWGVRSEESRLQRETKKGETEQE